MKKICFFIMLVCSLPLFLSYTYKTFLIPIELFTYPEGYELYCEIPLGKDKIHIIGERISGSNRFDDEKYILYYSDKRLSDVAKVYLPDTHSSSYSYVDDSRFALLTRDYYSPTKSSILYVDNLEKQYKVFQTDKIQLSPYIFVTNRYIYYSTEFECEIKRINKINGSVYIYDKNYYCTLMGTSLDSDELCFEENSKWYLIKEESIQELSYIPNHFIKSAIPDFIK